MLATYLKFFSVFQFFFYNSYFSDFIQKCNLSVNFSRNRLKFLKCMGGGGSYRTYIKRVLSCYFQITLKNGNIDGGGGECNFLLTILKENCLLLQLPINSSYTVDARITKPICMIPLCIQMLATCLKFVYVFQFCYIIFMHLCP